jgi:tRNA(Ile)-lysidine synthase TilS/MesJ
VPVSDSKIASLSIVELQWYACMIEHDLQEASNKTIEYIEYLAAFAEPDVVERVRKERENAKTRPESDPEVFASVLAKHFGKELSKEELING